MKIRNLFLFALFIITSAGFGQHYSLYSNYVNNGLVINPAYAGRNDVMDFTALHRRQWTGLSGAPVTTSITLNSPLKKKSTNLGLSIIDERIGSTATQNVNGIYAYRFKAGENMWGSFGLQAGFLISRIDWSKLKRNDQDDDLLPGQLQSTASFVSGIGYYMHNENFFAGISMPYMVNTGSKKSILGSPVLLNAGYSFLLTDSLSTIKPSVLVRYVAGSPVQYDLNVNYYYKQKFGVGVSYRAKESVIGILEIPINKQFRIYYSYDFGLSNLKKYNNGSHEIMLRYLLFPKTEEKPAEPTTEVK